MSPMSSTRFGGAPDSRQIGSWASEIVPLSVRREMLERELNELGFRRKATHVGAAGREGATAQQQQQAQGDPGPNARADRGPRRD
jgi:hypothetical protein